MKPAEAVPVEQVYSNISYRKLRTPEEVGNC
jgi:hypothetical protein